MSLFSKTEVNQKMLPFIENGEGVGVVKVNGYGKASARMESYKIIFDSYEGKSPIIESVSAITYLSYKKGNFISEPKLEIGISHKKYILSGVDNNDDELETFYRTILDIKNLEKERKKSSHMVINKPITGTEDELDELDSLLSDSNVDLEKEVLNEVSEEEVVDNAEDSSLNESEDVLEKIVEDDSDDDFEVLEELDEDEFEDLEEPSEEEVEVEEEVLEEDTSVEEEVQVESEVAEEEVDSEVVDESDELEDLEETEEIEEIILESDEPIVEAAEELIVEEPDDDDSEEFNDELIDTEIDSDRIITDSDEKTLNESIADDLEIEEELSENSKTDSEIDENVMVEEVQETVDSTEDTPITTENMTSEIGKMKQQLYSGINNIQNELNSEDKNGFYAPVYMKPDPVDQIRRYHELKEDGIITEEEFELKKKQLLDL